MRHIVGAAALAFASIGPCGAQTWPFSTSTANGDRISGTLGECRAEPGNTSCDFLHDAVDIQPTLNCGSTVYAAISGSATFGHQVAGGFSVNLGPYEYLHLASHTVREEFVSAGSPIGLSSATGAGVDGCHLHFAQKASATAYKTPLLTFSIQDTRNGTFDQIVLRQGVSTLTLTAGATINMGGSIDVDLLVRSNDAGNRLFGSSTAPVNWAKLYALVDGETFLRSFYYYDPANNRPGEVRDVYSMTVPSSTFRPFVEWYWMEDWPLVQGSHEICLSGWDLDLTQPRLSKRTCVPFQVDLAGPDATLRRTDGASIQSGGATNETSVIVSATDTYGLQKFVLSGPTTATQTVSGTTGDHTFTSLTPNSSPYTVSVHDVAGNITSGGFIIDTSASSLAVNESTGSAAGTALWDDRCYELVATDSGSGVCPARLQGPAGQVASTANFVTSGLGPPTGVYAGNFCGLAQGTYTYYASNCAGTESSLPLTVSTRALTMYMSLSSTGWSDSGSTLIGAGGMETVPLEIKVSWIGTIAGDELWRCQLFKTYVDGVPAELKDCAGGLGPYYQAVISPPAHSVPITVTNSTFSNLSQNLRFTANHAGGITIDVFPATLSPNQSITGHVTLPQVKGTTWAMTGGNLTVHAPMTGLTISTSTSFTASQLLARTIQVLRDSALYRFVISGSDVVLNSTMTLNFQYLDSVNTDTTTARIFRYEGASWSSAAVTSQSISKSTSGVIVAAGWSDRSGTFAILFAGQDSSAPVTSWSIQGSSRGFGGITFVSTYSYLVLSSTDPTVSGFASGLATTYYRIDGLPGDAFTAYSSSLSFLPGTHWIDFYAVDWAGNVEGVKRSTITVTAGSVTDLSNSLQVDGNLLVGFLGSGAKAEVVARAESDYALMVSSVDGRAMLAVDSANFASIGTAPAAGRLTLAGVSQDTALALRSGNSTASVTGAQIAFGYDGTSDIRHALYTQHGSAAYNNKMVFNLWTPATGSSSTLGNLPVLSLEGSSITPAGALVHIMPAGLAEKELVVSNGAGLGLGNVLRWERWQPSASIFKMGIERLSAKDEQAAWADVIALRPARYRRKVKGPDGMLRADPNAPLERGYIFEEIPESVRAGPGAISVDERLVNAEMALKAAIREMNSLEERLKKLKAGRK